jgi:hypothetical protein
MRILARHDAQGNVHEIVVSPADSPRVAVTTELGLLTTEVEAPEEIAGLDVNDPESLQRLTEMINQLRVEAKAEASLVRKTPESY